MIAATLRRMTGRRRATWAATALVLSLASGAAAQGRTSAQPAPARDADALLRSALGPIDRDRDLTTAPRYELDIDVDDSMSAFRVTEVLRVANRWGASLDEIVLRIHANAVGEGDPPVRLVSGECEGMRCDVRQETPSAISVRLGRRLAPSAQIAIRLELEGTLRAIDSSRTNMLAQAFEGMGTLTGGTGSGGSGGRPNGGDYGLLARGDGISSFASFVAVPARRSRGRWERGDASTLGDLGPDEVANVRARIRVPRGVKVVATGITVGERDVPASTRGRPSRREHEIAAALVREFAFAASDRFEVATRRAGDVEVRSWFLANERAAGEHVLEAAVESLRVFERRFGPYPFTELDVVEAPLVGGAGGVELSGMALIASMFYRPAASDAGGLGMLAGLLGGGALGAQDEMTASMREFVTAHEVAHQWWHGLVGSDSRANPWVDESLAQYSAVLYVEERHGAERARLEADRQVAMNYHLMRMMGSADGRVDRPIEQFEGEMAYAGLVYGKGPFMYRELRRAMGDAAFFDAIRRYVARHRFGTASPRAILDEMARGRHRARVRAIARRWLEQARGDQDLGEPSMSRVLGAWMGEDAAREMGPMIDQVMRMMGGRGGGGGGVLGDEAVLREAMRVLGGERPGTGTGAGTGTRRRR